MSSALQECASRANQTVRVNRARARNPHSQVLTASLLLTWLASACAGSAGPGTADRVPGTVWHHKGRHPLLPLTLRGGEGVDAGAGDDAAGLGGIPPASDDPMGFLKDMPELKPGARYAGVDGYKDDGMNTYRAQAIRKDILDWDVDDTTLDNATLADPTVVLGNGTSDPFERDLEKYRPTETITIPPRPDAFKNLPPPQVDPADGFDFNMDDDDEDFAPRAAMNVSDGVALAGQIGDGGLVVRRTYVEEDEDSSMPTSADIGVDGLGTGGDVQEGESLGGGLGRESRKTLLRFLGGKTLVEEDVIVRDAYTGPRFKWEEGKGPASKWDSPAAGAADDVGVGPVGFGWGCKEREVVDENGEVWITSSPAIKVPQEVRESMREVRQEGGGVQGESLDEALGRFYAAHNSSNAGMCGEIARRFTGQEDLLNAMLRRKYGSDLTSVGFEAGPRGGMGLDAATNETLFGGGSGEVDRMIAAEYVEAKERENQWKIHEENMQTIAKMTPEQVARAQEQIATQLSPEMIKLLTNRGKQRLETLKNATVSAYAPPELEDGEGDGLFGDKKGGEERVIWPANLRGVPKKWLRGLNDTFWEFFTSPDGPWVHVDEAEARIQKKKAMKQQEAEQANLYANMIKLDPENVEAYKEAAKFAKHVTKDKTLAMEYLQASVKLNPSDPDALSELAAIMSERGLPEQAQQLLEGALELDPSHAQSICEYGRLCEGSFNDLEAAYGMYIQALESNPRHLDSLVRLAGLVLSRDAEQHFEERFEFIEKLLLRAFEIDEKEPRALANYATLLHEKVLRTREDDDADHAETMYMRAIMADPSRVQALSGFGDFEMTVRRDADRAELLFRTALEYDMEHCATLCHYAVLLGATGSKNAAAEDMFRRAIQSNPSNVDVLGEHANFLYRGKKDELAAEAQYRHALSLNPQHIATLNNFATMLLERAEPGEECSEAEQLLFTALRLEPSDVDTILNCASLLWEIKRDQEASRQMCLRALKAQPDHVGALCQYAVLQLKMNGDAEAAMNTIERARLIDPTNEFVISGQEWFRAQVMQQRADKAAAIREKACEEERMYRERLADAEAGQGVAGESKEGVDGGVEGRVEGAQDCRSPGVPGGGQNVGGASRGPAAVKREVEGPKQGPRYESLGMERLPDDIPDGTVMSDASVGCLVGNSAVAKTAGGYPGGGMPIGDEEVEEIFRGAVAAAQQGGIYTGGRMNAGDPSLAQ